jgi:hypothetical protein
LRPYPQYSTIYTEYSPSGKSWYDSMQIKVTQRPWHGLQFLDSFTWSKEQDGVGIDGFGTLYFGGNYPNSISYLKTGQLVFGTSPSSARWA